MFENLEFNPEHVPKYKLGFHLAQIIFAIVLWILEIVVFRADDTPITGGIGWTFAVVFLSIPAWVYLTMSPRFPRTRRFAHPTVMAIVDGLFTIIWLSAFSTQAAYNTAGNCKGVCGASKAIVGLGFFVFLFFAVTTFISIYTVKYFQWHNRLPGYDKSAHGGGAGALDDAIDPDKAAFSMAPHGEEAYAPVNMNDRDDDGIHDTPFAAADPYGAPNNSRLSPDPYGGGPPTLPPIGTSYGGAAGGIGGGAQENPFRDDNPFDDDTSYNPGGRVSAAGGRYAAPTAHDDPYDDARFPTADYDRITR